tara:strand:- start:77 stop:1477 length:1401 start_codon:yes stop_codon:yes gene_type:complete
VITPISLLVVELEAVFEQRLEAFTCGADTSSNVIFSYSFEQYYLPQQPYVQLLACVSLTRINDKIQAFAGVIEASQATGKLSTLGVTSAALKGLVEDCGSAWINLSRPLCLKPIAIAKPWGQEIWYTGIEARGQSLVEATIGGLTTPLPWLLSLAPQRFVGGMEKALCLLKVLDPLPDEVYGDLYFEMHEQKREVYVVTHVDQTAWPDKRGAIRFGFNQALREELGDEAFKLAYFEAVKAYELVRREIDIRFDRQREQAGFGLKEPLNAQTLKSWHGLLPITLQERELMLRRVMESFTAMKPLQLGDVVKVPCFTPHALQHGVRTVEFQTPVYERKILSFGQKVLTQSHWDTERALQLMSLQKPESEPLPLIDEKDGCCIEQVVRFDDFEVLRVTLAVERKYDLSGLVANSAYALFMPVVGDLVIAGEPLSLGRAFLMGQALFIGVPLIVASGARDAVILLAVPRL